MIKIICLMQNLKYVSGYSCGMKTQNNVKINIPIRLVFYLPFQHMCDFERVNATLVGGIYFTLSRRQRLLPLGRCVWDTS
jgi:hypothetical protein